MHFAQVIRIAPALLAEGSSEHSPQFSMPPSATVLHAAHPFPVLSSALGKNPDPHSDASTQEVESLVVLRYLSASHFVHVTLLLAYVQAAYPATPAPAGVRPVFAVAHDWQVFFCVLLSVCSKYPSGHVVTQEVDPVGVCRKPAAHSMHVAVAVPAADSDPGALHLAQFATPTYFLSPRVTPLAASPHDTTD